MAKKTTGFEPLVSKQKRQEFTFQLIGKKKLESKQDVSHALESLGVLCTQASISRNLSEFERS